MQGLSDEEIDYRHNPSFFILWMWPNFDNPDIDKHNPNTHAHHQNTHAHNPDTDAHNGLR